MKHASRRSSINQDMRPPETCPNCGADVPRDARACPECGADEETGWSEQARYDELGLPDEEFNYDEFVKNEFGDGKPSPVPRSIHWFWWLIAVGLIAGLGLLLLR
jgi:ribosomal protein L32